MSASATPQMPPKVDLDTLALRAPPRGYAAEAAHAGRARGLAGARARWGAGALGASVLGTTQWSLQSRIPIDAPGSGAWSSADASPPIGRTGQVCRCDNVDRTGRRQVLRGFRICQA